MRRSYGKGRARMPKMEVNGVKLHYHVHGKKGTPIVFIHPPTLTSAIFRYQQVQLAETHRVITFDVRGHGHSEPSEEKVTYPLIVEDMIRLMDELEVQKAIVAGYSTGGSVALEAMLTHPKRFSAGILIGAMSEASGFALKSQILLASALTYMGVKRPVAWGVSTTNADMPITYGNLYRRAMEGDPRNWQQYYRYSLEYSCTDRLPLIHQPVLLINGEKDKRFEPYAAILRANLPNVEQAYIRRMSHQVPTKAADRMNALIQHWSHDKVGGIAPDPEITNVIIEKVGEGSFVPGAERVVEQLEEARG